MRVPQRRDFPAPLIGGSFISFLRILCILLCASALKK
jgi:hypothetical protein